MNRKAFQFQNLEKKSKHPLILLDPSECLSRAVVLNICSNKYAAITRADKADRGEEKGVAKTAMPDAANQMPLLLMSYVILGQRYSFSHQPMFSARRLLNLRLRWLHWLQDLQLTLWPHEMPECYRRGICIRDHPNSQSADFGSPSPAMIGAVAITGRLNANVAPFPSGLFSAQILPP